MRYRNFRTTILALLLAMLATAAAAETLYKLIDKNGKVTYVEKPPKDFDGKVIRLDIDTSANTAAGRSATVPGRRNEDILRSNPGAAREAELQAAREKLETARKAYEEARDNPGENDVQRMGTKSGFTRPVFSEEYQRKLDGLEAEVKQAEQELQKLERGS
ncbi:MAG TPA: DUF4124 domain-containing protein [Usitatibacter sp.]|nr:DUF4124 domain-containing protein [Usitatibacter sp.]